jgi:hypothetical protein
LQSWVDDLRAVIAVQEVAQDPVGAFEILAADGRLQGILALTENSFRGFRPRFNSPQAARLEVDFRALIIDWLSGKSLQSMCEDHLGEVLDEAFRYEQLSEFVSRVLEHLLPWITNIIVGWINEGRGPNDLFCPGLPAFLRFGVTKDTSLDLCNAGVRSRRLAHVVAAVADSEGGPGDLREWLGSKTINEWKILFDASPGELADLISYSRNRDARITSRVLSGEDYELRVSALQAFFEGTVELRAIDEPSPARIAVWREEVVVADISPRFQTDLGLLLGIGIPIQCEWLDPTSVRLRAQDPALDSAWFGART